jgi:hypothetical protein
VYHIYELAGPRQEILQFDIAMGERFGVDVFIIAVYILRSSLA